MKIYLDLLPEERKKQLHRNKIFRLTIEQEILFLLPLLLLIGILFGINVVLKVQKDSIAMENTQTQSKGRYQELDVYESEFKASNELATNLLALKKGHLHWAEELVAFSALVPEGVNIENLTTKNYQVMISGLAKTRDGLLAFKEGLEKSECIKDVNVPLSNMVQRENVDFQLDFSIKEECLKNKTK